MYDLKSKVTQYRKKNGYTQNNKKNFVAPNKFCFEIIFALKFRYKKKEIDFTSFDYN